MQQHTLHLQFTTSSPLTQPDLAALALLGQVRGEPGLVYFSIRITLKAPTVFAACAEAVDQVASIVPGVVLEGKW